MITRGSLDRRFWLLVWCYGPDRPQHQMWSQEEEGWEPEVLFHIFRTKKGMDERRRQVEDLGCPIIASGGFTVRDIFYAQIEGWEVLDPLREARERIAREN